MDNKGNNSNKRIIAIILTIIIIILLLLLRSCSKKEKNIESNSGSNNGSEVVVDNNSNEKEETIIDDNKEQEETKEEETEAIEEPQEEKVDVTTLSYWVNFFNIDGSVLQRTALKYGSTPSFNGEEPTYYDGTYNYYFTGWDKEISKVYGTQSYTAQYYKVKKVNKKDIEDDMITINLLSELYGKDAEIMQEELLDKTSIKVKRGTYLSLEEDGIYVVDFIIDDPEINAQSCIKDFTENEYVKDANSLVKIVYEEELEASEWIKKDTNVVVELIQVNENMSLVLRCIDCLAKGTKITMADYSIKNIEDIVEGDLVLTFNHEKGIYEGQKVYLAWQSNNKKCPFTLHFSNGINISVVGDHDFFEKESLQYVAIFESNAQSFIGKHFYNAINGRYEELLSVTYDTEPVEYYEIYTEYNANCVAEGLLNVAYDSSEVLNIYEFNEDLSIDHDQLGKDIDEFGLYEYPKDANYQKELFDTLNWKYVNIIIGKGFGTMEEFIERKNAFLENR